MDVSIYLLLRDEYNVAELKVHIVCLEDALAAETKRRVDATTQLDERARVQVYDMEELLATATPGGQP